MKKLSEYEGHKNLETAVMRKNFTRWVFEEMSQSLKGNILEIGSGLGTYSTLIVNNFPNSLITLSDISSSYIANLEQQFTKKNILVAKLDLNNKNDFEKIGYNKFDSIMAINILEHVKNDEFALQELYKMLKKNGTLVILVPSHKLLYNIIDESIGHWRRYSKKELEKKIKKNNFKIEKLYFFNILGIIGWFLNGSVLKKKEINRDASTMFDKFVPGLKIIEKILGKKFGLSIICYCKKL